MYKGCGVVCGVAMIQSVLGMVVVSEDHETSCPSPARGNVQVCGAVVRFVQSKSCVPIIRRVISFMR